MTTPEALYRDSLLRWCANRRERPWDNTLEPEMPGSNLDILGPRTSRCPKCFWALYDGHLCQNPECTSGEVAAPIYLNNREAHLIIHSRIRSEVLREWERKE